MRHCFRLFCVLLSGFIIAPATAADYIQIGVYTDVASVRVVRGGLEREGIPVEERLTKIGHADDSVDKGAVAGKTAIILLVGPFDRIDKARYQLIKLKERGWNGILRRYADAQVAMPTPKLDELELLAQPPEMLVDDSVDEPMIFTSRWSGHLTADARSYLQDALYAGQKSSTASLAIQPELYVDWNDGRSALTFVPFVRIGDADEERNHADVRELIWLTAFDDWELRLGIGKVFWGVTESQHLVDVINQNDLVENTDGEDKLGQLMAQLTWITDLGSVDFFLLPGFRERTFPGLQGHGRLALRVDTDQPLYESSDKEDHLDWALRWNHYFGDIDVGLSHFSGTSREPAFVAGLDSLGQSALLPRYDLLDQTGLTLQAIFGGWLWKLEATSSKQLGVRNLALVGGFEYTEVGIFESSYDLGMLAEYLYDERDAAAPGPFEDDLMLGLRWVFNDMQSSEILIAAIYDLDGDAIALSLEGSRRLGQSWKLAVEYRGNQGVAANDALYPFRNDDYLQLELARYF